MRCLLPLLLAPMLAIAAEQKPAVFAPTIERLDPALDQLLAPDARLEKLA